MVHDFLTFKTCFDNDLLEKRYVPMSLLMFQRFNRSSHPEVFLVKGVLKICSKVTGGHPC